MISQISFLHFQIIFLTLYCKVYQIHLEIANELQGKELEVEKVELLGFIRAKLKNYSVGLKYSLIATEKMEILDSKGIFDKLAAENSSLDKFRKLFNLDIEF